jgi:hypothetical protein
VLLAITAEDELTSNRGSAEKLIWRLPCFLFSFGPESILTCCTLHKRKERLCACLPYVRVESRSTHVCQGKTRSSNESTRFLTKLSLDTLDFPISASPMLLTTFTNGKAPRKQEMLQECWNIRARTSYSIRERFDSRLCRSQSVREDRFLNLFPVIH